MGYELLGIALIVGAQLALAFWVSRKIASEDDFLVAGRHLGPVLVAGSIFATWFGAETCIGAAGQVYTDGLGRGSVEPFAYGLCLVIAALVFAAPLWRRGITTLADLFRQRFGTRVEHFAAVLLVPTSVLWAAAQVRAFGHILSSAAPIDLEVSITIAAGLAVLYTALGGLLADVFTDLLQGAILVLGLVVLLVAVVLALGGLEGMRVALDSSRVSLLGPGPGPLATLEAWALPICGSVTAQEVVQRSLAARSPGVARSGGLAGAALYIGVGTIPVLLGLVGPGLVPDLEDGEALLPTLARDHLPTLLYVLFSGALVSAILSTVDSALLVAGSLAARNFGLLPDGASDRARLRAARIGVVVFGAVAWILALESGGVFELIEHASGFGSAGVLVCVVMALFSTRGGPRAAGAALGLGIAAWVLGAYVVRGFEYPYLTSLGAAIAGFAIGAAFDRGASSRVPSADSARTLTR